MKRKSSCPVRATGGFSVTGGSVTRGFSVAVGSAAVIAAGIAIDMQVFRESCAST